MSAADGPGKIAPGAPLEESAPSLVARASAWLRSRGAGAAVVRNVGWLFLDQLVRMAVAMFVGAWLARYLGPARYGSLSFAVAFTSLFAPLAALGLDSILVRELIGSPARAGETLGTSFVLRLAGGAGAAVAAAATVSALHPGEPGLRIMVCIAAAALLLQPFDGIDLWFQSEVRSRSVVLAKATSFLLASALRIFLIWTAASVVAFVWAGLFEAAASAAGLLLVYGLTRLRSWKPSAARAVELLRDSWPLMFSGIVIMIYMRIDQVMLGQMVGVEEVGIYSAAVRLSEVWFFIPMAVYASWSPGIIEARKTSEVLFLRKLQELYNAMALLAYAVAIPATLVAGPVVRLLFGRGYERAAPMLVALVWSGLFTNLGIARSAFLMTMNWTRTHLFTVALGGAVNIGLNLFLIPRWGGMGAAIASLVAYWLAAHGVCFLYPPLFRTGRMLTRAILFPKAW